MYIKNIEGKYFSGIVTVNSLCPSAEIRTVAFVSQQNQDMT